MIQIGREPVYIDRETGEIHELPMHRAFLESTSKRRILVMHRRARKTSLALEEVFKTLMANPGIVGKTLAPLRKQAKEIIWDDPDMLFNPSVCPPQIIAEINKSDLRITLTNGSIYTLDGADNVQNKRGSNVKVLHLTEAGDHDEAIWTQIYEPILEANGGIAILEGNPRGKNWYARLFEVAPKRQGWERFLLSAEDSPIFTKEQLEGIKMSVPDAVYRSEYLCEWIGSTGMVFRFVQERSVLESQEPQAGRSYRIGIDLGKHADYTVLTCVDKHTHNQVALDRFNGVDWVLLKARIMEFIKKFSYKELGNSVEVRIECNGVGDPIFDDLYRICSELSGTNNITLVPFITTQASKEKLVHNLSILLDRDVIKLLHDASQIHELEAFSYTKSGNNTRYSAPQGDHDDIVMSLMIAYWEIGEKIPVPESTPERRTYFGIPLIGKNSVQPEKYNPFLIRTI